MAMGNLLKVMRRFAEAEPFYRRALIACAPASRWAILTRLCETLVHLGQYEKAERCADDAIQLGVDKVFPLWLKAYLLSRVGRLSEAEQCCRRALPACKAPERLHVLARLGGILACMGRYEEAESRLDEAIQLGDTGGLAMAEKAVLFTLMGRCAEAEGCYRSALPRRKPGSRRDLIVSLAEALGHLGRFEEAQQCVDEATQLGDIDGVARSQKANLLLLQSAEPQKALDLITEAMDAPEAPRLHQATCYRLASKAWALALLGRQQEAEAAIAQALQNVQTEFRAAVAETHWKVGKALAVLSRTESALEHFRSAHDADPNGLYGGLALKEIDALR
jgi:tetratricopeptide (TPR) repeat protein